MNGHSQSLIILHQLRKTEIRNTDTLLYRIYIRNSRSTSRECSYSRPWPRREASPALTNTAAYKGCEWFVLPARLFIIVVAISVLARSDHRVLNYTFFKQRVKNCSFLTVESIRNADQIIMCINCEESLCTPYVLCKPSQVTRKLRERKEDYPYTQIIL